MTRWFADAFYYVALLSSSDAHHAEARQFARELRGTFVTTQWVLAEVGSALASPENRGRFVTLCNVLRSKQNMIIVEASDELFNRGLRLYASRSDKSWSLVDCISFIVMQDRGIADALTGDRHFEQAGFRLMFRA